MYQVTRLSDKVLLNAVTRLLGGRRNLGYIREHHVLEVGIRYLTVSCRLKSPGKALREAWYDCVHCQLKTFNLQLGSTQALHVSALYVSVLMSGRSAREQTPL